METGGLLLEGDHFFHQCVQQRLAVGQECVKSIELKARFFHRCQLSSGVQFKIEALPLVPVGCSVDSKELDDGRCGTRAGGFQ